VLWLLATRIGALFVVLQAYTWVRKTFFVPAAPAAFAHARQILDIEQTLGLNIELSLQRWVLRHDWLTAFFNAYYENMKTVFFLSAALALLLAPVAFRHWRRVFFAATLIALPWYALYPLAPPRFMQPYGYPFVDTLGQHAVAAGGIVAANPYAAMPSMHVGWSAIAALFLAAALPWRRIGAILGAIHVLLMSLTVMATGNHYLVDILAGLLVDAVALAIVSRLPIPRRWPRRTRATMLAADGARRVE